MVSYIVHTYKFKGMLVPIVIVLFTILISKPKINILLISRGYGSNQLNVQNGRKLSKFAFELLNTSN